MMPGRPRERLNTLPAAGAQEPARVPRRVASSARERAGLSAESVTLSEWVRREASDVLPREWRVGLREIHASEATRVLPATGESDRWRVRLIYSNGGKAYTMAREGRRERCLLRSGHTGEGRDQGRRSPTGDDARQRYPVARTLPAKPSTVLPSAPTRHQRGGVVYTQRGYHTPRS